MGTRGLACSSSALNGKWPRLGTCRAWLVAFFCGKYYNLEASEKSIAYILKSIRELHGAMMEIPTGRDEPEAEPFREGVLVAEALFAFCH